MNTAQKDGFRASNDDVRQRLLEVAEEYFAEKGFDGTSIRELTSNAKCNIAAVNYHFGGKENLYREVFHRRLIMMRDIRLESIERVMSKKDLPPTLEELIRAFAVAFLEPLMNQSKGRRLMKLMIHEMFHPHLPKKMFVDELAAPTLGALEKGLSKICPTMNHQSTLLSIISIIGQLVHIIHLNDMFDLSELVGTKAPSLSEMVDHVVKFSTAGIKAMAEET